MNTPAEFLQVFHDQALRTVRLVRQFEDADLSLRPGSGSMSTAEQINHLCACHNFMRSAMVDEIPSNDAFKKDYDVSTVKAAVRSLGESIGEVQKAVGGVSGERWADPVAPFGPDWRMARGMLLYVMMDHEVHHRGQLTVYLRMAGKVPAMLYLPVSQQVLDY